MLNVENVSKKAFQFLLKSAKDQVQFNWVSRRNYYLPTLHGLGVY